MTALERAKQFVKQNAATTALAIVPLAMATSAGAAPITFDAGTLGLDGPVRAASSLAVSTSVLERSAALYGEEQAGGSGGTAVPEPGTLVLLATGTGLLAARRRRRRT